jgi:neutral ceramidase
MNDLRAGFAEVDITPDSAIPLWWVVGGRTATGVHRPLHGRVALFDDGAHRAAIVALDLTAIPAGVAADLRAAIAPAGGLAPRDILIACTHTHSSPHVAFEPAEPEYLDMLGSRLPEAMSVAAADLELVELYYGATETTGLTFNRRPMYTGNEVAPGGPPYGDDFVALEGPADNELQVLLAQRADGSIAGGFIGFACHPHIMAPEPVWSADFPGGLTEMLADRHGGTFLFLQGASGDLHWVNRAADRWWTNWWVDPMVLAKEPRARAVECSEQHAAGLLAASEAAYSSLRRLAGDDVRGLSQWLAIAQRSPTQEQVELAEWFLAQNGDPVDLDDFNRRISGHAFLFYENSAFIQGLLARMLLELRKSERRTRGRPVVEQVEVQALAVGDVAFVGYPAEMFTEFGLRTKAGSPFAATFVCELANGWFGYVTTLAAYEHGGYETRIGSNRLDPRAGDTMLSAALSLLAQLGVRRQAAAP